MEGAKTTAASEAR